MMSAGRRGRARFDSTLSVKLCQASCFFALVFTGADCICHSLSSCDSENV